MSYEIRAEALDAQLLEVIGRWREGAGDLSHSDFDRLAREVCAHQLAYNRPYARYCASFGYSPDRPPPSWEQIPAVPAQAFKEAALATFDERHAALTFQTSGTTRGSGGRHYLETSRLYDAALLAAFDRFVLAGGRAMRYLNLVPNPSEQSTSSLGYMMAEIARRRGDGQTGWFVNRGDLLLDGFVQAVHAAIASDVPVCIASTAFALVHLADAMFARRLRLPLPAGSRVIETGGFKGRSRVVSREQLYADVADVFGIPLDAVVAEYGMTELTSQYYDDPLRLTETPRRKVAPPWLRSRAVDASGTLPFGTVGALVHVDLANRSSCLAVATEDLGAVYDDGSIVLIGRESGAALRGCSLDAEELRRIAL